MSKRPWKIDERDAPSPRRYMQAVRAWMKQVQAVIGAVLLAQLADAKKDEDDKPVDPVEAERQARRLRDRLRQAKIPPPPLRMIEGAGESAARQASRRSRQQIIKAGVPATTLSKRLGIDEAELLGIDIAPSALERAALTAWATEGSDLIVSVGQDLVEGLDQHIMEAARAGTLARDLRQIVQDRLGISERHALFIARDQIAKLNGKITEAAQVSAGLTRYRWRSSNDQRTRPDHLALDGTIQEWSSPPIVDQKTGMRGHPGEVFQCRCVALAVLDDEVEEERPGLTRRPDVDGAESPYSPEQDEAARTFLGR